MAPRRGPLRADPRAPRRRRLAGGFGPTLAEAPLAPPLSGRLALAEWADTARLWLLLDGIVAAHLALPGQPPFLAVAEMRPIVGPSSSAGAALREAIERPQ